MLMIWEMWKERKRENSKTVELSWCYLGGHSVGHSCCKYCFLIKIRKKKNYWRKENNLAHVGKQAPNPNPGMQT